MAADGGDSGTATAERCPVAVHAASDSRPWHERQPHVLWQLVFDSGHVTAMDASRCMLVCRMWRKSIADSPVLRRRINDYKALKLVFDSGYVKQGDAFKCMLVSRQWHDCVHRATQMWRSIKVGRMCSDPVPFANYWPDAIAAKRPKEIAFYHWSVTRHQVSAILERNAQLRRLAFCDCDVDTVRALDSLQSPLHRLDVISVSAALDHFTGAAFARIVHSAPMLKQLRELRLFASVGDASMQLIAANFTQLSVLLCYDHSLTPAAVRHLCADSAHTRTTLRKLLLPGWCYSRVNATQHILAMTNLERLSVDDATDQWTAELVRAYKHRHNRDLVVCRT